MCKLLKETFNLTLCFMLLGEESKILKKTWLARFMIAVSDFVLRVQLIGYLELQM